MKAPRFLRSDISRLVISRRPLEAFWIGNDLKVTVLECDAGWRVLLLVQRLHDCEQVYLEHDHSLEVTRDAVLYLSVVTNSVARLAVEAPREIKILRDELRKDGR